MAHGDFTAGEILTAANLNTHIDEKLDVAGGTMTGNLNMGDNQILGVTKLQTADSIGVLADDEAAEISFDTADTRFMVLIVGNVAAAGHVLAAGRVGSGSAFVSTLATGGTATIDTVTGALNGVTGTDGNVTLSAGTGTNKFFIENRTGAGRGYSFAFLCFATGALVDGTWTLI